MVLYIRPYALFLHNLGPSMYKLRHITDNIHDTIYISEYECVMTSTPFFFRLHDVYQSSTVYMTLPSNRTKRYEHSLGTMHLAGRMFHAALTNAEEKVVEKFFSFAEKQLEDFCGIMDRADDVASFSFMNNPEAVKVQEALRGIDINEEVIYANFSVEGAISKELPCICYGRGKKRLILTSAVLQALRLAALFHDVGHPPFSHIVEELFQEWNDRNFELEGYNAEKVESLQRVLEKHYDPKIAFHENVGRKMTGLAFKSALRSLMDTLEDSDSISYLYYSFVAWLTMQILSEAEPFATSLHHFVDGPIDADRLDYIYRDTYNSGFLWGQLPYECVLRSIRLVEHKKELEFAFPSKITDTIDDILLSRYKIFARINSHHRTVRSANLLQHAIRKLVDDFLIKGDDGIAPEIVHLWESLNVGLSAERNHRKIAMWNDSWLMSVLQKALVTLKEREQQLEKEERELLNILDELILNKKRFYSVLKRGHDAVALAKKILAQATLESRSDRGEYLKRILSAPKDSVSDDSIDYYFQYDENLQYFYESGDFSALDIMALIEGVDEDVNIEVIRKCLTDLAKENIITSFFIVRKNEGRNKIGLKRGRDILLFKPSTQEVSVYDTSNLKSKLQLERNSTLSVNLYVQLCVENNVEDNLNKIRNRIVEDFAGLIKACYEREFPN